MAKSLISEELRIALCRQLSYEKYNENFYLFISGFLQNKGLDKLAERFLKQVEEENGHAKMIYDFLVDMNAQVDILQVEGVSVVISSPDDLAKLYLDRELETTSNLEDIKYLAIEEKHSVCEEFLRDMIKIQRTELEEASTFSDEVELSNNDWWKLQVLG